MNLVTHPKPSGVSWFNRFYRLMIPSGLVLFLVHSYYSLFGPLQPFFEPNFPAGYPLAFRLAGAFIFGPVSIGLGWLISLKFRDNLIGPILIHWGCAISSNLSHSFIPPLWGALSLYYSMVVVLPGMGLMLACFPSGRGVTPFWDRAMKGLVLGAMGYFLLVNLAAPAAYGLSAPSPLAIQELIPLYDQISGPLPIVLAGLFLTGSALTIYRYRITHSAERKQMRWLVGIALFFAILEPLNSLLQISEASSIATRVLVGTAAFTVPSLGISLAILQHHLWDIDVIIRRTLQYSVLSGLLGLTYFGLVVVLQWVFRALTGQSQNQLITVASTLAIAALFFPLRNRVQEFIDKRFYRKKYDAQKVLAEFAATCRDETDLDKLVTRLAEVIDETLQPEKVSVWIRPPADGQPRQMPMAPEREP